MGETAVGRREQQGVEHMGKAAKIGFFILALINYSQPDKNAAKRYPFHFGQMKRLSPKGS